MRIIKRKIFLVLGAGLIMIVAGCGGGKDEKYRFFPHLDAPKPPQIGDGEAIAFIGEDFMVKPGFSSHLPLIVLGNAELTVIDGETGDNNLSNAPLFHSQIRIRPGRMNADEKGSFAFTLVDGFGTEKEAALLGMAGGADWALNASLRDKSLMRDYLAYSLASKLMPETPGARFCEVFFSAGEGLKYQGVYLLTEEPGAAEGISPTEDDKLRRIIYSEDPKVFSKYPEVINVDSFVDYFIINEFLQNYDAGLDSAYVRYGDRVILGPVRNNDRILGNTFPLPFDPEIITMQRTPFFERLTRDAVFLDRIEGRFSELRRNVLGDDTVIRLIDETAFFLGPARLRDWKRWSSEYTGIISLVPETADPEGVTTTEQTLTFEQELIKIKYLVIRHGRIMGNSIHRMTWQEDLFDSSYNTRRSTILIVAYCFLFILSVRIGRRG